MGKIDSWAIRFCFQQFLDQKVCAFPTKSKVSSLGFSKDASNTAHTKRFFTELDKSNKVQFVFDDFIHYDDQLLKEFSNVFQLKIGYMIILGSYFEKNIISTSLSSSSSWLINCRRSN